MTLEPDPPALERSDFIAIAAIGACILAILIFTGSADARCTDGDDLEAAYGRCDAYEERPPDTSGGESAFAVGPDRTWASVRVSWTSRDPHTGGFHGVEWRHAWNTDYSGSSWHACDGSCYGYSGWTCNRPNPRDGSCAARAVV